MVRNIDFGIKRAWILVLALWPTLPYVRPVTEHFWVFIFSYVTLWKIILLPSMTVGRIRGNNVCKALVWGLYLAHSNHVLLAIGIHCVLRYRNLQGMIKKWGSGKQWQSGNWWFVIYTNWVVWRSCVSFSVDFAVSPRQGFCDNQMRQMFEDVLCKGLFRCFERIVMFLILI